MSGLGCDKVEDLVTMKCNLMLLKEMGIRKQYDVNEYSSMFLCLSGNNINKLRLSCAKHSSTQAQLLLQTLLAYSNASSLICCTIISQSQIHLRHPQLVSKLFSPVSPILFQVNYATSGIFQLGLNFKFSYFPRWVLGGWGETKIKAKLSPAKAGAWAEFGDIST